MSGGGPQGGGGDGIIGQHLPLQPGHDPAGQVWTNFGSGIGGDLEVFYFEHDGRIRISTIFPEGKLAKQYRMQRGETEGVYSLFPFDDSEVVQLINLDMNALDTVKTPEGLIIGSVPESAERRARVVRRKRKTTEWREEMRPQIAFLGEKLVENETANLEKESKFGRIFALLVGTLSLVGLVDIEKILPLLEKGKEEIQRKKKELIRFVRRTKRRTNEEEEEQVDIRVALENNICSRSYMTKLQNVINSQENWESTLVDKLSVLEAGVTEAAQNKKIIRRLQVRQEALNMMTTPDCTELPFNTEESEEVLYCFISSFICKT